MSKLLRRPTRVACFYCNTQVDPKDPRNFRCRECGCWNRYDAHGEIMSDEPAMHDEKLNVRSFARRASPRKDRLPSVYGQTLFCRTCQTNQMLISNLLSNYLPPPDDPEYADRVELLPEYRESVEARYPPVCADCLPAVEEEIKKRNQMARTSALGGFLRTSRGKGKQRQEIVSQERDKLEKQLVAWRIRGILWVITLFVSLVTYTLVLSGYMPSIIHIRLPAILPMLTLLSIVWTAWDPKYASLRRSQIQGREVRQRGKREYNVLQMLAWFSRLVTSVLLALPSYKPPRSYLFIFNNSSFTFTRWYASVSLCLELLILIRSLFVLRLESPPLVRLVEQYDSRMSPALLSHPTSLPYARIATPADPDILASLTLSNNPVLARANSLPAPSPHNPIFGVPSLNSAGSTLSSTTLVNGNGAISPDSSMMFVDEEDQDERDPNAMDWSPESPVKRQRPMHASDDTALLRPQRFFAPEEPTGLEHLFARTIKLADEAERPRRSSSKSLGRWKWKIIIVCTTGIIVLLSASAAGWRWWQTRVRLREIHSTL